MSESEGEGADAPRLLWVVFAVVLLGAIAALVYRVWPLLHPPLAGLALADDRCDLRAGPCEARFASGERVRLEITPLGIPTAMPLRLGVEVQGRQASAVEVDFAGVDMYMGFNRVALSAIAPGRYEGTGMIPVCVRSRMTWEARVLLHTADGLLAAPFRFDTIR